MAIKKGQHVLVHTKDGQQKKAIIINAGQTICMIQFDDGGKSYAFNAIALAKTPQTQSYIIHAE